MYRVAVDKARGLSKMEPVAICNYGIFLFNQRKDTERAVELLRDGLQRFVGQHSSSSMHMLFVSVVVVSNPYKRSYVVTQATVGW